jgi:hypothetical protein
MTAIERVLWGDHPDPAGHLWRTVGWFAALVGAVYVVLAVLTRAPFGVVAPEVADTVGLLVTFYGPPLAAAVSTARRGGLLAALALGAVPAVVFSVVAALVSVVLGPTGDAPAWVLAAIFAAVGVAGTTGSYAVVAGGRLALWRYRRS